MGVQRGKGENTTLTEANIFQYSESSNSPSLIRFIFLYFGGLVDRGQPATLFYTKEKRCNGYISIKQVHLKLLAMRFSVKLCSLRRYCKDCTIFLGCSLEFAALSFIFSKTFSCSECFISVSCKCSLVVKTLSSNVVAMALHCLLSHLHVFNPSFSRKRHYK